MAKRQAETVEEAFPDESPQERSRRIGEVGKKGEEAAARYLWKKGYRILERNFRRGGGEMDIIAEKKGRIHFVEVKATEKTHRPEERVDPAKRLVLRRTAAWYLGDYRDSPEGGYQFDVLSVWLDESGKATRFLLRENCF